MLKRLLLFTLIAFFHQLSGAYSQITINRVDAGPYTSGSNIAATFTLGDTPCINKDNVFNLILVSPGGVELGTIGTYTSFYGAFINGTIPNATVAPPGPGYTLRIRATSPALQSTNDSAPFTITTGAAVLASLTSAAIHPSSPETYGFCSPRENTSLNITNQSTATAEVTADITNQLTTGAPITSIIFDTDIKPFTPGSAHYVMFGKVKMPDGRIATKAYFIINNKINTSFSTSGTGLVCLPQDALQYGVTNTGASGIQNNFPGNLYRIVWGDGSIENYTLCDLKNSIVEHKYTTPSCGRNYNDGTTTYYNVFGVNISVQSPFCGQVGNPISTYAKVIDVTENRFNGPTNGCTRNSYTFINTSIAGGNPDPNSTNCIDNNVTYTWYINGVPRLADVPRSTPFIFPATTVPGKYEIRLESNSSGACQGPPVTSIICIQDPPVPSFNFGTQDTTGCAPFEITPINTSVLNILCDSTINYRWIVTSPNGVTFVNSNTDRAPTIRFANPGTYDIKLEITTASCGAVITNIPQRIILVDGQPIAQLPQDVTLCDTATITFDATKVIFAGTQRDLPTTYTWTVTNEDDSPLDPGDYSFVNSDLHTKYPKIKFNSYKKYKVKIVHTNTCRSAVDFQTITFLESPSPSILSADTICYNANVDLKGVISNNNYVDYAWSTPPGGGTFTNIDVNALTATYVPSPADLLALKATVILTVNTGLDGTCKFVPISKEIFIHPNNFGTNVTDTICTGTTATLPLTSSVTGSSFTWVATNPDGRASGYHSGSGTTFSELLTNTSGSVDAVVIYTITPTANNCIGIPYTYTVVVTPIPVITPVPEKTICQNNSANITVTSNIPTLFSWTSVRSSPGVTGNTDQAAQGTPARTVTINDVLLNSTFTQQTVTYKITPYSSAGCKGDSIIVVVKVDPAVTTANAGPDENICSTDRHKLGANAAKVGTGQWSVVSTHIPADMPAFDLDSDSTTFVTNLKPGNTYTFAWTITGTGLCQSSADSVTIVVNMPTIPGSTSSTVPTVCQDNNSGVITLTGQTGSVIGWQSLPDGQAIWADISGANTNTTYTFSNLTITTQFRAVVRNGGCTTEYSTPTTITVAPATTIANAGPDQVLCAVTTSATTFVRLAADPTLKPGETGRWVVTSNTPNAVVDNPTDPQSTVSGIVPGQIYRFTWIISGNSPCGPDSATVTINNLPPIRNIIISADAEVCNGKSIAITDVETSGGDGINYAYTWQSSSDGISWTTIPNQTGKDLTFTLTETLSFRRHVTSTGCPDTSNIIRIIAQPPIGNNNISADQDLCSGVAVAELVGTIPTGSNSTFSYQWQSRLPSNNTWTDITTARGQNYTPGPLTETTLFRRIVSTSFCIGAQQNPSDSVTLTIRQNAKAEFTYVSLTGCAPFQPGITVISYPLRNSTYTWYADNQVIGVGPTFPTNFVITESSKTVRIKLVTSSSQNCAADSLAYDFSTVQAVPASYTQNATEGCGPLTVNFVNTSPTPPGATFRWDFGNGTISTLTNPPPVIFEAEPTGKDTTYTVTLTATTSCGSNSITSTVFVKAKPVSVFSPSRTDGCSPMLVNFTNTSPGTTNRYFYDFGDGSPVIERTDKLPVQHTYNTTVTTIFYATLTVINDCGTAVTGYNIRVAPQNITPELVVDFNEKEGCAPLTVNFHNNSIGASRFTFDFGDGSPIETRLTTGVVPHIFTRSGTFTITMTAYNSCSEISTTETVTVLAQPTANFDADNTLGCPGLSVKFRNTTQDGFTYLWDFGDGSATSNEFEPTHVYNGNQEYYTVTLTATNVLGCSMTVIRSQYIHIVQPPVAIFNVTPSTLISIPNYTFTFVDESTNSPTIWEWDFGDGTTSALQSPSHTYPDTGTYKVTLKVLNQQGCFSTTFKNVTIKGVPGYLFVPNSFIPGSEFPDLRTFTAKGSGIESWRFSVFNKWGELLWETTKLEEGRPAEGWDGTFKGADVPQGVYFWKIDVKMVNGTEWKGMTFDKSAPKRTGPIHLIR